MFVSIQVEQEVNTPVHTLKSIVGGDLGVKRLLTLSDNMVIKALNTDKQTIKVKALQRKLAKKKKFSANWKKLKEKITRQHSKVTNIRHDQLHKISTSLSKSHVYHRA